MLVPGLERVGPAQAEGGDGSRIPSARALLAGVADGVVGDLVVVHRDDPGERVVGGLQVGVALVELVPAAVGGEVDGLGDGDGTGPRLLGPLVDVVADEHHEVEVLDGHAGVRGVVAVAPVLARGDPEAHLVGGDAGAGERPGAALRAGAPVDGEPVPVPGVGLEAARLDVDRVGQGGDRRCGAGGDDRGEGLVARHLPVDGDIGGGERVAAAGRDQPGPEDDARADRGPRRPPRAGTAHRRAAPRPGPGRRRADGDRAAQRRPRRGRRPGRCGGSPSRAGPRWWTGAVPRSRVPRSG